MNEQKNTDEVVNEIYALGRSWAEYGLVVGRMAMLQSARTLERGAKLLDTITQELNDDRKSISSAPDHQ